MGWDRHKLQWDGTDEYVPWTTLMIALWEATCGSEACSRTTLD